MSRALKQIRADLKSMEARRLRVSSFYSDPCDREQLRSELLTIDASINHLRLEELECWREMFKAVDDPAELAGLSRPKCLFAIGDGSTPRMGDPVWNRLTPKMPPMYCSIDSIVSIDGCAASFFGHSRTARDYFPTPEQALESGKAGLKL